jgi:hypothetical protein
LLACKSFFSRQQLFVFLSHDFFLFPWTCFFIPAFILILVFTLTYFYISGISRLYTDNLSVKLSLLSFTLILTLIYSINPTMLIYYCYINILVIHFSFCAFTYLGLFLHTFLLNYFFFCYFSLQRFVISNFFLIPSLFFVLFILFSSCFFNLCSHPCTIFSSFFLFELLFPISFVFHLAILSFLSFYLFLFT